MPDPRRGKVGDGMGELPHKSTPVLEAVRASASAVTMMLRRQTAGTKGTEVLVNLNARVPKSLWRRVRMECAVRGRLIQTFTTEAIEEQLHPTRRRRTRPGLQAT